MSTVGISGLVIFLFGLSRISFNFLADSLLRLWLSDWMFASVAERNLSCQKFVGGDILRKGIHPLSEVQCFGLGLDGDQSQVVGE